jgi:hypothetical protein
MSEQSRLTTAEPWTPAAAFEFLQIVQTEGELKPDTVKALRNATLQILAVDPTWETLDLRELELEAQADLFEKERHEDFSQGSLKNYRSRFLQTINMYKAWARGEDDWKRHGPSPRRTRVKWQQIESALGTPPTDAVFTEPITEAELPAPSTAITASPSPVAPPAIPVQGVASGPEPTPMLPLPAPATSIRMMPYKYPLRDDVDAELLLPRDLTAAEANRLARYIATLPLETEAPV